MQRSLPCRAEAPACSRCPQLCGGAAGGGKSDALVIEALRQVHIPHYRALILRKTYPQLSDLVDKSQRYYLRAFPEAQYNATSHVWIFPSGAKIYFGSMQHTKDRTNYQGKAFDFIGFDELTHFEWEEYSYMMSRNRPTGPGTRVYLRATTNPGGVGHGWVKARFITPAPPGTPIEEECTVQMPDGTEKMLRRARVFIPSSVFDNPALLKNDPGYLASLAAMPEAEQLKVIEKIIDDLKKREKEEAENARREEYLAQQEAAGSNLQNGNANAPTQFTLNADKSWYFYNTATRNAGRTDFQKRWGSRKWEDDWRRRNKTSFSLDDSDTADSGEEPSEEGTYMNGEEDPLEDEEAKEARKREQDPHYPEYYLRQIPKTDVEKATAGEVIQEGLYNSGLILKDKLEDFGAASAEWRQLMSRYPENVYRLDIYYNEYLMAMRRGLPGQAEKWRQLILSEFADSKYGQAMADPNYLENLRVMERRQNEMYEQAYEDYLANRNTAVHKAYDDINREFPMSPLIPKFMFLNALAYVTENRPAEFGATIRELLERYPSTDLTPLASAWLKGINEGRDLHSTATNTRSMLWDIRLTNDSTALAGDGTPLEFTLAPEDPHYLVLLFSTDALSPNQLLYEVARHNFSTYVVRDFDLELMNFGKLGLLIIKGFANQGELNHYRGLLARDGTFSMPSEVRPVEISKANFDLLLQGAGSFDDYFKFIGEETIRETHESVLPPDEYPSAEEMYPEAAPEPAEPVEPVEPVETIDSIELTPPEPRAPIEEAPSVPVQEAPLPATPATPAPTATPAPAPALPSYPLGSEGDEED